MEVVIEATDAAGFAAPAKFKTLEHVASVTTVSSMTSAETASVDADGVLDDILQRAERAQLTFTRLNQTPVDRIVDAVIDAVLADSETLAQQAFSEMPQGGSVEDQATEIHSVCTWMRQCYRTTKTCGLIASDYMSGKNTYAFPAGPVCAILGDAISSTLMATLLMAKTRNSGVLIPHPCAWNTTGRIVSLCRQAGEAAGAPPDWIQSLEEAAPGMSSLEQQQQQQLSPFHLERYKYVMESLETEMIFVAGKSPLLQGLSSYQPFGKPVLAVGCGQPSRRDGEHLVTLDGLSDLEPQHFIKTVQVAERQKQQEWYTLPKRIFFNRGCVFEALRSCAQTDEYGNRTTRALIVTDNVDESGQQHGHVQQLQQALEQLSFEVQLFVSVKPDMECIRQGLQVCEEFRPDIMFCLGGDVSMNVGKYVRAQYEHPELAEDHADSQIVELRNGTFLFPKLASKIRKVVTIPTTSGTGSEVSPSIVIMDDSGVLHPISSCALTPDLAICDSTWCDALPKEEVANAGMDAVTHAIESYVSATQHNFTKQHSLEAIQLLFENLPESYKAGTPSSRDAVHRGTTISGLAFSNSPLGICHALAHQLANHFHLPHGTITAILLPHILRLPHTCEQDERYRELARSLGAPSSALEGLIQRLTSLSAALEVPKTFKAAGVQDKGQFLSALDRVTEQAFADEVTYPHRTLLPAVKDLLIRAYDDEEEDDQI